MQSDAVVVTAVSVVIGVLGVIVLLAVAGKQKREQTRKMQGKEERSGNVLLEEARKKISKGDGDEALGCIISAIKEKYGEEAVMGVLEKAKAHVSEEKKRPENKTDKEILKTAVSGEDTILSETYTDVSKALKQSVASGDSRVCTLCGQIVATSRLSAHSNYWCPSIPSDD